MKKYLGFIFVAFILSFVFCYSSNVLAANLESGVSSIVHINGKTTNETRFKDGLVRKEIISCRKYDYNAKIPNSTYEYIKVRADVIYTDASGKNIACAYFESIFRYNKKLRLAKCLSTLHGQSCTNNKYSINIFGRTKNLALDIGESFGKIKLYSFGMKKDKCKYIFSCDKDGNILRCMV